MFCNAFRKKMKKITTLKTFHRPVVFQYCRKSFEVGLNDSTLVLKTIKCRTQVYHNRSDLILPDLTIFAESAGFSNTDVFPRQQKSITPIVELLCTAYSLVTIKRSIAEVRTQLMNQIILRSAVKLSLA